MKHAGFMDKGIMEKLSSMVWWGTYSSCLTTRTKCLFRGVKVRLSCHPLVIYPGCILPLAQWVLEISTSSATTMHGKVDCKNTDERWVFQTAKLRHLWNMVAVASCYRTNAPDLSCPPQINSKIAETYTQLDVSREPLPKHTQLVSDKMK